MRNSARKDSAHRCPVDQPSRPWGMILWREVSRSRLAVQPSAQTTYEGKELVGVAAPFLQRTVNLAYVRIATNGTGGLAVGVAGRWRYQ